MTARTGHCRHYSYDVHREHGRAQCARGCDISGPGATFPCMPTPRGTACDIREEFTEEERAEAREASDRAMEQALAAFSAITKQNPQPGDSGTIECPSCGGQLRWASAASNGHLRAACETEGCVRFMS